MYVDQNKVTLEFLCENCEETQTDLMVNVIENGPPLCYNLCCGDCPSETVLNKVWIEENHEKITPPFNGSKFTKTESDESGFGKGGGMIINGD